MTTLALEDLHLSLAESLQVIERRAATLGIETERVRGYAGSTWLSVRVEGASNILGFHLVDGRVQASLSAHAMNDGLAILANARKVADAYFRLMEAA
jgi:hypothetical protein